MRHLFKSTFWHKCLLFAVLVATSEASVQSLITREQWNKLFPERWGVGEKWKSMYPQLPSYYPGMNCDYYSYENFVEAVDSMKQISMKENETWSEISVYRMDKTSNDDDWKFIYNNGWGDINQVTDFSEFLNKQVASEEEKKRELVAFLAIVAYLTKEGSDGLFYREEILYERAPDEGQPSSFYQDWSGSSINPSSDPTLFPKGSSRAGQQKFYTTSYHGRGPIMLRGTLNYGRTSGALFAGINCLVKAPQKLLSDGAYGFMSAIWYWMTAAPPKSSCHQLMYTDGGFDQCITLLNGDKVVDAKDQAQDPAKIKEFYRNIASVLGFEAGVGG